MGRQEFAPASDMISSSITAMVIIDLIIIGLVVAMLGASWAFGVFRAGQLSSAGRLLIIAGAVLTGLFYLADLLTMTVLPSLIGREPAMAIVTRLHLDARWLISLASLLLIGSGVVLSAYHRRQLANRMRQAEQHIATAQSRIVESEVKYRALAEQTPNAVYCYAIKPPIPIGLSVREQLAYSYDAVLVDCNQVFAQSLGKTSPAEILGMKFGSIAATLDAETHAKFIHDFVASGFRLVDYKLPYAHAGGAKRTLQVSVSGVVRDGHLVRVWGANRAAPKDNGAKAILADRLAFQQFVTDLSTRLLTATDEDAVKILSHTLEETGRYVSANCATIALLDEGKHAVTRRYLWSDCGEARCRALSFEKSPEIWQRILSGEPFAITSVDEMEDAATEDTDALACANIQSIAFVPALVAGELIGACVVCSSDEAMQWSDQDMTDLQVLANLMVNKVIQIEARQSLSTALAELRIAKRRVEAENIVLRDKIDSTHEFEELIGESDSLRRCLHQVEQVAATAVPVLLQGETGTGKELFAKAIKERSERKDRPMVKVNCAAMSTNLMESELFGHEKGAFTDAMNQRKGRFELADGGTLFLDEIAELPIELQSKLLRVLQGGEFERLGGTTTIKVDVRVIAATNVDLQAAIDCGKFRSDLYYRISAFPITLPALRDRRSDIPLLAEHFVRKHAAELGKKINAISASMLQRLTQKDWPGNVRELEGAIQRSLIAATGPVLELAEPLWSEPGSIPGSDPVAPSVAASDLRTIERVHITRVLEQADWVVGGDAGAAARLGLPASTLRSKMKKLGIGRQA